MSCCGDERCLGADARRLVQEDASVERAQVRGPAATGLGNRADLRIDASVERSTGQRELLSVMIGSKAPWHPRLTTDLRDQLVERYLAVVPGAHGICVARWADPDDPTWKQPEEQDRRRAVVAKRDRADVAEELVRQARELSDARRTTTVVILDLSTKRQRQASTRQSRSSPSS